LTFSPKKLIPN